MGIRITQCTVGLQNYSAKISSRNPFSLTYGTKAVIPTKLGYPTLKTLAAEQDEVNEELIKNNLDVVEEVREMATIKLQAYQQDVARHYNK